MVALRLKLLLGLSETSNLFRMITLSPTFQSSGGGISWSRVGLLLLVDLLDILVENRVVKVSRKFN